jgi:hypothetical protein
MFPSTPVHSFARKTIRLSAGVGLCAGVGSCDSSPSSPDLESGRVASIILVAGQDQSQVVGKELPSSLEVRVVDLDGHPVAGQIVNFRVVAGGGSVFAGTSLTSADGSAKERWTLGTSIADSQRVEARAVDPTTGEPIVFGIFRATARADIVSIVTKRTGDGLQAQAGDELPTTPSVTVTDRYGNPVGEKDVVWSIASGGGFLSAGSAATSVSDKLGVASLPGTWNLGAVVGTNTLTATVAGIPPAVFTAIGVAGSVTSISIEGGNNQSTVVGTSVAMPLSISVRDARGNGLPNVTVAFAVESGGGHLGSGGISTTALTDANGIATATGWTLGAPGANTLRVTAGAVAAATFTAMGLRGNESTLTVDRTSTFAGEPVGVTVTVRDPSGNPVTTATSSSLVLSSKLGGPFGAISCSDGQCTTTYTPTAAGDDQISATVGGEAIVGSPAAVTVFAAHAVRLVFLTQPPATATNGQNLTSMPVLQVQDEFSNPVRIAGTIVQAFPVAGSGPGALVIWNDTTRTDPDGIATFSGITLNGAAGSGYRLAFGIPGMQTFESDPITLLVGPAYMIVLRVPASGALSGAPFDVQPVLEVTDTGGNPVSISDCITARISFGATLVGGATISSAGSLFTFRDLGAVATGGPGPYTISYAAGCCGGGSSLLSASQSILVH